MTSATTTSEVVPPAGALSLEAARARIIERLTPVATCERVSVRHALDRVLGEDVGTALAMGRRVRAADLGVMASLGRVEVRVRRRLRVAIFSTGDALRSLGEPLAAGETCDANRYTLNAMLTQFGAEVLDLGVVRNEPRALRGAIDRAGAAADVVIASSGVTIRSPAWVRDALAAVGEIRFLDVRAKPCRPLPFGRLHGGAVFFGFSSNPLPVAVMFHHLVRPALDCLAGAKPCLPLVLEARARADFHGVPGFLNFRRGRLEVDADGGLTVDLAAPGDPGLVRLLRDANCFIVLPGDAKPVRAGDRVRVEPFAGLRRA